MDGSAVGASLGYSEGAAVGAVGVAVGFRVGAVGVTVGMAVGSEGRTVGDTVGAVGFTEGSMVGRIDGRIEDGDEVAIGCLVAVGARVGTAVGAVVGAIGMLCATNPLPVNCVMPYITSESEANAGGALDPVRDIAATDVTIAPAPENATPCALVRDIKESTKESEAEVVFLP